MVRVQDTKVISVDNGSSTPYVVYCENKLAPLSY